MVLSRFTWTALGQIRLGCEGCRSVVSEGYTKELPMSMDALIDRLEEGANDVDRVLASTKNAYSRRAYGEKAWKAAAEYLVKKYGAESAVKIMHHKAMRWAQDQAKKRDVAGLVASVKSTVDSWPASEIVAEVSDDIQLQEGLKEFAKSAVDKVKSLFGKGKKFKGEPDYWRSVHGHNIGFTGKEGSGKPVIGPRQIVSKIKAKTEAMEEARGAKDTKKQAPTKTKKDGGPVAFTFKAAGDDDGEAIQKAKADWAVLGKKVGMW